jgi:hypothetical protein
MCAYNYSVVYCLSFTHVKNFLKENATWIIDVK